MTPQEMVAAAIAVAEDAMTAGELPIGAVVMMDDQIIGRAHTRDKGLGRRLVHADLLALTEADETLGWQRRPHPLRMAVNLEPCLMCLGAAMTLGISEVYFGLESPGDGAAAIATAWRPHPDMAWYKAPAITGGTLRDEVQDQFRRYCLAAPESGFRRWAQTLTGEPSSTIDA